MRLYRKGWSGDMIADKLKMSPGTVYYWAKQEGITRDLAEAQRLRRKRE